MALLLTLSNVQTSYLIINNTLFCQSSAALHILSLFSQCELLHAECEGHVRDRINYITSTSSILPSPKPQSTESTSLCQSSSLSDSCVSMSAGPASLHSSSS